MFIQKAPGSKPSLSYLWCQHHHDLQFILCLLFSITNINSSDHRASILAGTNVVLVFATLHIRCSTLFFKLYIPTWQYANTVRMHATGTHRSQQTHVPTISIRPSCHSIPRSPGLAEKRCHDIAHRPPHILSQLYRPLLIVTFRSRSFVWFTFGRLFAHRYMYLDVDRGSAFWASPASSCAQYAREEPGTSAIFLA